MTTIATAPLDAAAAPQPDWDAVREETVELLQALIRFNTSNPPGNEIHCARYVAGVLEAAGIEARLLEPAPERGAVVARLRGTGERGPVLLVAHMDVVGVEREQWTSEPFGGELREGYLYGRGAIDDKGMLAANLQAMLLLKRHVLDRGGTLARDVVFVATADEEADGTYGMGWLLEHHPELLRADFALNEGGRVRVVRGRPLYVAVQCAEKVPHLVTLTAHGPAGHAAVPLAGNALARLGRALAAVGQHREPLALTPTVREFFRELCDLWPDPDERAAMAALVSDSAVRARRGARAVARAPALDALLRNGVSPTLVAGGVRTNVIPTTATATLDVRTLPGESVDAVAARLRRTIADPLVEVAVTERGEDAPASDFRSPMFASIAAAAQALNPGLAVVPYLSTGATDSACLR